MYELTTTEQNFLCLLRASLTESPPDRSFPEDTDAAAVLRLAAEHKLYHMILSAMPEELLSEPQNRRTVLVGQVTSQIAAADRFLRLLGDMTRAGFHPLVVKGMVCRTLYSRPELRPSGDEDLYVPEDEFEPCCAFLVERGMTPDKTPFSDYGEVGWRDGGGLYIELHRDLFEGDESEELREIFAFDSLETEEYPTPYGTAVTSLNPHDHFLYLLLHARRHFIRSGFGIRQICDIGLWAGAYAGRIDWQKLSGQCGRMKLLGFAAAVLGIARHDLRMEFPVPEELDVPPAYGQPMLKDILCGGIYGSAEPDRQHSATLTLNAVKSSENETRFSVWKSVFPPREDMERKYPWVKRHPILLPAAWIRRMAGYAVRSRSGETHAAQSLAIGRERIALLRCYGLLD